MYLAEVTRPRPAWWASDPRARELERDVSAACSGVRVLKRLTRLSPIQRQLLAENKIKVLPRLFELKREIEALRKARDPRWPMLHKAYQDIVAKGFGEGYALANLADELGRARCELARAKVEVWEVLAPPAVAARIARAATTAKKRLEQRLNEMLRAAPPRRN